MRTIANSIVPVIALGLMLGNAPACGGEVISIGTDVAGGGHSPVSTPEAGLGGTAGSLPVDTSHVDELCGLFTAASALTTECCTPEEQGDIAISIVAKVGAACEDFFTLSVTKGRVVIDPDALALCALPVLSCPMLTSGTGVESVENCAAAVHGTGAEGAPCDFRMECKPGLTCIGHSESTSGTCGAPPQLGETCYPLESGLKPEFVLAAWFADENPLCANGVRCANFSFGSTGTCIPLAGSGDMCTDAEDCQAGLTCSLEKCTNKPAPPAAQGGLCERDDDCETGLTCSEKKCIEPMPAGSACKYGGGHSCLGRCKEPASGDDSICVSFCSSG